MSANQATGVASKRAYVVAIAVILFFWQVAAWFLPDFLMPDVPAAFVRLWEEFNSPTFWEGLGNSMTRLGAGYGSAIVLGILVGLVGGTLNAVRSTLKAAIIILQSIPSIAWVPLFLILMGFGNLPIIVVVAIGAFFPTALSVMNATESVEKVHISAARVMGASKFQMLRRVYFPAVTPELITGAQLAFGNAWRALISAEMIVGFSAGLGKSLAYSGEIADMTGVMTNILVIAVLAAVIDQVILERIKHRLLRYQYL
ncbi:ABC transporter permease [Marinobacter subterrani]|uniref:ABC-type nitrate/sulfonate/bicarbonate transport system, permease component n=1 Tax=Marinobacter subterrani TaxID=1658765 RepID=A0A0J7JFA4_9GAMM|nr:ABC transporter permease [Marinobacter subterrani]KMQ76852.1 ABC-type nitrate/sulfonate/bicarbonate transport system, permease component [Marinobacter subterrani]